MNYEFNLVFRSLIRTFAPDMQISNKIVNIFLAVIAAGLFAVCIASIVSGMK